MIDSSLTIIPIFIKFNLQVQKNAEMDYEQIATK